MPAEAALHERVRRRPATKPVQGWPRA
jgi:hypothetical protein